MDFSGNAPASGTAASGALHAIDGSSVAEAADAVEFFRATGLPLSSVVLGLLDQSDDCIKVIGLDGSLQFMNCNGKKTMQIDDFAAVRGKAWDSLWPDESRNLIGQALDQARAGRMSRFEAFCPTAKGEPRWWEVTVSPLHSPSGEVEGVLSTSRDLSDRRRREEAATTVALEMRHRLRNAHSIGAALLIAAGKAAPEHREFSRDMAARLARLSDVHAHLVDVGGGIDLASLCADVAEVFSQAGGHLDCQRIADVQLDEDRARAMSLLLGELTTNSLKHGALGRGGEASMSAVVEGNVLKVEWIERFAPEAEAAKAASSGQGAELMRRIIQLYRGSIDSQPSPNGFRASITLPLS